MGAADVTPERWNLWINLRAEPGSIKWLSGSRPCVEHFSGEWVDASDLLAERDALRAELSRLRDDVQRGSDRERELAVLLADRADERDHAVRQGMEAVLERDSLRLEVDALRSAPVAAEVPEPTVEEWWNMVLRNAGMCESSDRYTAHERGMRDTLEFLRGRLQPIDPSRILKDGERAVPVSALLGVLATISQRRSWMLLATEEESDIKTIRDALRSSKEGA